ncbi:hypothetical protein K440DRAFT_659681 [Wilcoxina mikolae CBS 423.85]|nr:hypothetical protein K440DRAFT_659681 [Wilcoxina mikolae CBS 423.85]
MSNDTPETPRLTSSYPETPARPPNRSRTPVRSSFGGASSRRASPASLSALRAGSTIEPSSSPPPPKISPVQVQPINDQQEPWIPLNVLDAPTQRLYAIAIFGALQAYKLYDLSRLYADDGEITMIWFYMKWWLLDVSFFWYLPSFRIPWLRFSPTVSLYCILSVLVFNTALPHLSTAPFFSLLAGVWKLLYDRELSISERRVKWGDIIHNDTHIMGKYTVHILPEGVAKLNPEGHCFCLGPSSPTVTVPIKINGTQPINIQLTRIDLEGAATDTINLSQKEIKKLISKAAREEAPGLRYLPYTVKQPGLYRLTKVRDVSELDVRVHSSHALVVACPKATIKTAPNAKKDVCMNDMSNLSVQLEGLPPLSVTYSRVIRGKPTTLSVGRIHPENYDSPLLSGFSIDAHLTENDNEDLTSWAKRETLSVPLNDSMTSTGDWLYEIDQVTDGCGNLVDYKAHQEEGDAWLPKFSGLGHKLVVHDRPVVRFDGCDPQNPLALPRGRQAALPLRLDSQGADAPYRLNFDFTPFDQLGSSTEHSANPQVKEFTMKSPSDFQWIKEPGLYSIRKVSSSYCSGDVLEPASCLVITPPEPSVTMEHDEILDKCTKSSIGLNLDLTLVGSPPFTLQYREIKDNRPPVVKTIRIDRTRHQVRFTPEEDGHYTYEFFSLSDKNYNTVKIDPLAHRIVQTVKPIAGAHFINLSGRKTACIDEPVEFDVKMQGAAPLTLHYDLIHGGRRTRISDKNITEQIYTIKTPPLSNGGDYSLALTSVEDQSGCKVFLESEAKIKVRFQRPKAQFSPVEGKMSVRALEGKEVKIPLRLTGEGPWFVKVRNIDRDETPTEFKFENPNSALVATQVGTYQIESVRDSGCPGNVLKAPFDKFTVTTIERPKARLPPSGAITAKDDIFIRKPVCEGDEDSVELAFMGQPPFTVDYERTYRPEGTSKRQLDKVQDKLTAGLSTASVRLETSKAGLYEYRFYRLSDGLYDDPRDRNMQSPIVLQQTVNPRPSTAFLNPSKVYKYCLDSAPQEDSIIPIQLVGTPPFALTIHIKHHSTGKKDVIHLPNIDSNHHDFKIPPHALTLGDHSVSIHKVRDSRGCTRRTDDGPHVTVAVADMPTISAADQRTDYCVGERIAFTLAGLPPFAVEYKWNGETMLATNQPSSFVRVAERPGNFTITGLQDSASDCKVGVDIRRTIHEVPSVRISEGTSVVKGIPEGDQAEIKFRFYGTPPFTFTYTRSAIAKKGQKPRVLESHSRTAEDYHYSMFASQEGTYEVTSIEDRYCSYPASNGRKS